MNLKSAFILSSLLFLPILAYSLDGGDGIPVYQNIKTPEAAGIAVNDLANRVTPACGGPDYFSIDCDNESITVTSATVTNLSGTTITGSTITANTNLVSGSSFSARGSFNFSSSTIVNATKNSTQGSASGVKLHITFANEITDTLGEWNSVSTFTAVYAGNYVVSGAIDWAGNTGGTYRRVTLDKNSSAAQTNEWDIFHASGGTYPFNFVIQLAAGDKLQIGATQDVGSLDVVGGWLYVYRVP